MRHDSKKINIMHFVHSLNEGGIERLLLEICIKLDKSRFNIQICCLVEKGTIAYEFEKIGIRLHLMNARRDFKIKHFIPNFIEIYKLSKLLKKEKVHITHGHEFFSTVFSRIASVLAGVKKRYITLHNVYYWWGTGVHKTQKLLSNITTKIICNSNATLKYSLKHDKINEDKYLLIYNGIDCNKFSPKIFNKNNSLFKEFNLSIKNVVCMSVGSISSRKGFGYLVRAAKILHEKYPQLIFLIIGGKEYKEHFEYEYIENLIRELNLNDNIYITGNRNNVNEILNLCDIYIMPSVAEGFGLALVEAMAIERICIASDIEPFKEIIDDGKDGFFFESKNEVQLAQKIKEVLSMDKSCLEQIKKSARIKAVEKFSSDRMIKEYEKLYIE